MTLTILIVLYILGIFVCRKARVAYQANFTYMDYDWFDALICFIPIAHWGFVVFFWLDGSITEEKVNNIAKKFFEKDKE